MGSLITNRNAARMSVAALVSDTRCHLPFASDQYSDHMFRASEYRNFAIGRDTQSFGFMKLGRCSMSNAALV